MGKRSKTDQSPESVKAKHKKSPEYLNGSGGSNYAIKNQRRREGDLPEFTFNDAARRMVSLPVSNFESSTDRKNSLDACFSRASKSGVFETEAYNGGAMRALRVDSVEIFQRVTDKKLFGKSCFIVAQKSGTGWDVTRYIGMVGTDGKFRGEKESAQIGRWYHEDDLLEALGTWVKSNNPTFKSSSSQRLHKDSRLVTSHDAPKTERSPSPNNKKRNDYGFGGSGWPFDWKF